MNKREFVQAVAERAGISKKDAGAHVEAFFEVIGGTIAAGEKITLPGFGSFERVQRPARDGFNHLTKKPFSVPATYVPKFTPGTTFKALVSGRAGA